MSTYTHRYVEIKIECLNGVVWNKENLPDASKHEGEIWKIGNHSKTSDVSPFYKAVERPGITFDDSVYSWEPVEKVDTKWVPIKYYGYLPTNRIVENKDPYYNPTYVTATDKDGNKFFLEENLMWCNNGGYIRDNYISSRSFSKAKFADRGLPADVSEEVKKDIESEKYHYGMTWVSLAEWEDEFENARERFVSEVQRRFETADRKEIEKKLDTILKTLKNPDYQPKKSKKAEEEPYYEDTLEYMFEEEIWELFNIRMEIDRTEFITEYFDNYYSKLATRIIYYLA